MTERKQREGIKGREERKGDRKKLGKRVSAQLNADKGRKYSRNLNSIYYISSSRGRYRSL